MLSFVNVLKPRNNSILIKSSIKSFSAMAGGLKLGELVSKLNIFAPESSAESWDNVGLLLEPSGNPVIKKILLTNDLTENVMTEALENSANLIITYHPLIFSPLKRITQNSWKERIITKCMENRIAVYSPHTSWDVCNNGVNDWLIGALPVDQITIGPVTPNLQDPSIGPGRMAKLKSSITLEEAISLVKKYTMLSHVHVSVASEKSVKSTINSVAVCAGSGASVLQDIDTDLYLTGEMSHHSVLDANQKGKHVILLNHSNAERGFLTQFKERLPEILKSTDIEILVSTKDRDPLETY